MASIAHGCNLASLHVCRASLILAHALLLTEITSTWVRSHATAFAMHSERIGSEQNEGGNIKVEQLNELMYLALETELGGVQVYTTALQCAINEDLREWEKYLEHTQNHVETVSDAMEALGLDTQTETPGRKVVRHIGESLVRAMEMALQAGDPAAAQLVAPNV